MKHSDSIANLAAAFVAAQAEMPGVEFDTRNPFLKNRYASLGAVIKVSAPVLAKHGLAVVQIPVSSEGESEKTGPSEELGKDTLIVTSKRKGVEAIGLETVLLHTSGEWLSETLYVPLAKEKGKSTAQMAGGIITYLRRYARAAVLGMYADEDVDGNELQGGGSRGGDDAGGFDSARPPQGGQPPPSRPVAPKPAPASPAAVGPATPAPLTPLAELRKKLGPLEAEFTRCLQGRKVNDQGQVALVGRIEALSEAWAKFYLNSWDAEIAKVEMWCQQNPPETAPAKPIEVPRDPQSDNPDEWRTFLMPWGEKKGTPLADLDKKYLFGLWANYKVQTEYKGKPNSPERIAADTKFRKMLDDAGLHYGFK